MTETPIVIVQGGQWGSEGKGMVAGALCLSRNIQYAVRTGGVNAGHTIYYNGKPYKMCQLPTGWVNPGTKLVLGAGAYINPRILWHELEVIGRAAGEGMDAVIKRTYIDYRAGLHTGEHTIKAGKANRHYLMGATGKGCSEAVCDKIRSRGQVGRPLTFKQWTEMADDAGDDCKKLQLVDCEELLNHAYDAGESILLEGTQGSLLDLHLGPYPYTTHKQTGPAQWIMEAGLSPNLKYEIIMCLRTYPIRVAGNSGPMHNELSWSEVARRINKRLIIAGRAPLIEEWALVEWAQVRHRVACGQEMEGKLLVTDDGGADYMIEKWSDTARSTHRTAASEFHALCFDRLGDRARAELKKLFEFTTVTNKLRRISEFNVVDAAAAVRQARPDAICLTFLNYWYPELWGCGWQEVVTNDGAMAAIESLSLDLDVPVKYVTTGPESKYMIDLSGVPKDVMTAAMAQAGATVTAWDQARSGIAQAAVSDDDYEPPEPKSE